jgi:DHA2 family multidrug resistance protein-like MFS transporter
MIPVLLISIDNTVLGFAIPAISTGLHPTGTQLLWIVDIYALMLAGLLVAMGSLGDRVGRRRLLIIGSAGFGAASLLAAFSTSAEMLILARGLLGIFGATLMPSTLSLIRNIFDHDKDRRIAIATWAAMFSGGAALGPILGGFLLEHFHWSSVFFINLPLIALFIPAAALLLPESRDPNPGSLRPVLHHPVDARPRPARLRHQTQPGVGCRHPLLAEPVRGDRRRSQLRPPPARHTEPDARRPPVRELRVHLGGGVEPAERHGTGRVPLLRHPAAPARARTLPGRRRLVLIPGLITSVAAGYLACRSSPASNRASSCPARSAQRVGMGIIAFTPEHSVMGMLLAFLILGIGLGAAEVITNDLILSAVPANRAGAASAISETAYEFGSVMGTTVLGGLSTFVFGASLHSSIGAKAAEPQFDTLGSALEYTAEVGGKSAHHIAEAALTSFETGVQWAAGSAVVLVLIAAVLTSVGLKGAGRILPGAASPDRMQVEDWRRTEDRRRAEGLRRTLYTRRHELTDPIRL